MYYLDFRLMLFIAPAVILGMIAQWMVRSAYAKASQIPTQLSGFAAARRILDAAGLQNVDIEQTQGYLSDHYDPSHKVLRLSTDVYHGRTLAAVGIAAHESGHALQDDKRYLPLVIRNLAVPAASFGSFAGMTLLIAGVAFNWGPLLLLGILLFSGVVFFQVINLPVEFDASRRAKIELQQQGIVAPAEMGAVRSVLRAAALTYVAGTLQAILTLAYYVMRYLGNNRRGSY
ncbi:zinc metallopeptidase [Lignipirellula cremea]|uniref:Neutral zinc metallopeptidase n=1 Tax=Lignipirellula cremea TaxID=2528010 RepID=A0A518DS43_9BACT|nr:zinc metallopeptidase [Lignipirellula cremea]QDU94653.1 Putative neutral zinc metallopeptidase [Lignipirellula cremea]